MLPLLAAAGASQLRSALPWGAAGHVTAALTRPPVKRGLFPELATLPVAGMGLGAVQAAVLRARDLLEEKGNGETGLLAFALLQALDEEGFVQGSKKLPAPPRPAVPLPRRCLGRWQLLRGRAPAPSLHAHVTAAVCCKRGPPEPPCAQKGPHCRTLAPPSRQAPTAASHSPVGPLRAGAPTPAAVTGLRASQLGPAPLNKPLVGKAILGGSRTCPPPPEPVKRFPPACWL